jgi:CBS domain-containing protein
MLAKDVMTRDVITVTPDMTLVDAAKLLLAKAIHSAPVVDGQGRLVGLVHQRHFIRRAEIGTEPRHAWWQIFSLDPDEHAAEFLKVHGVQVRHVMTRQVATVAEDATLGQVVDTMERFDMDQVAVVLNGKPIGVVSCADILRLLGKLKPTPVTESRSDDAIRKDLDALLAEAAWATVTSVSSSINHEVSQGVICLSGVVGSEREREALLVATQSIPGVRAVEADLAIVPRDIAAI